MPPARGALERYQSFRRKKIRGGGYTGGGALTVLYGITNHIFLFPPWSPQLGTWNEAAPTTGEQYVLEKN